MLSLLGDKKTGFRGIFHLHSGETFKINLKSLI